MIWSYDTIDNRNSPKRPSFWKFYLLGIFMRFIHIPRVWRLLISDMIINIITMKLLMQKHSNLKVAIAMVGLVILEIIDMILSYTVLSFLY